MSETPPQAWRRPPDAVYKVLNPLLGLILRSPLHGLISKRLLLLEFTGRKSGRPYRLPIAYVRRGETLLLGTESRWKANLRGGARVGVILGGRHRAGMAAVIDDASGMADPLAEMIRAAPQYGKIVAVRLDLSGHPHPDDLERARQRGSVVIRIELD